MSQINPEPQLAASARLPTQWGEFLLHVFQASAPNGYGLSSEQVALVMGDVRGQSDVLVRVHSECMTGEVFGSSRCDCREQLRQAQQRIAEHGQGVIVYLRQEGRSVGLTNKIRAYALQDQGADTVDANLALHLPIDARQYHDAVAILKQLGVVSIQLLSNNPQKQRSLEELGVVVSHRLPVIVHATPHSERYLHAKRSRLHHDLPDAAFHKKDDL